MPLQVNQRILPKFFLFQQLNGKETFFEGVSTVAFRELLAYDIPTGSWISARYDDLPYRPMNREVGDDQTIIAKTEDKLRSTIKRLHKTFSGLSWINSYSGGTDSSLQAILLKEFGHRAAYTTCHAHSHGDDVAYYAQSVAEVLDIDHHTVRVQPQDLLQCIERAVIAAEVPYVFEGECLLEGMHQAIVADAPPDSSGKLVVNGHGSDALFAHGRQLVEFAQLSRTGFPFLLTIANILLMPGLTPSRYHRYRAIGNALWTGSFDEQGLQTLLCNPKSVELVIRAFHLDGHPSIFSHELEEMERYRVSPLEQMYRLWIFEHETTRANNVNYQAAKAKNLLLVFPFRDLELVDFIVSIPTERKLQRFTSKYYIKQILSQYLPQSLVHRRKILQHRDEGFLSILKSDPGFAKVVDEIRSARYPYFDFDIDEIFGNPDYENIGVFLINFHLWHRHFIDEPAAEDVIPVREESMQDQISTSIAIDNIPHPGGVTADGV
jgi:asparagine synthase (glutamine-hydrolysing)